VLQVEATGIEEDEEEEEGESLAEFQNITY
jgi:hypothetical protein